MSIPFLLPQNYMYYVIQVIRRLCNAKFRIREWKKQCRQCLLFAYIIKNSRHFSSNKII
jgi:hypothetical protein